MIERIRTGRHGMVSVKRHKDGRWYFYSAAPEEARRPEWRYRKWPVGESALTLREARRNMRAALDAWDTEAFDFTSAVLLAREAAL
ncbi:hypothetical protein [Deinococcus sp. S9]|uniref:hypothetical protein n=1 Tax=Deinococcus sp. S9 TaxID=2545754 RepID=UPI0010563211|nr:hypothetical protein [Deinococcus sp. S9]TDE87410.1 hypothetical protein E0686_02645 [Deinococcus sp. S9]